MDSCKRYVLHVDLGETGLEFGEAAMPRTRRSADQRRFQRACRVAVEICPPTTFLDRSVNVCVGFVLVFHLVLYEFDRHVVK